MYRYFVSRVHSWEQLGSLSRWSLSQASPSATDFISAHFCAQVMSSSPKTPKATQLVNEKSSRPARVVVAKCGSLCPGTATEVASSDTGGFIADMRLAKGLEDEGTFG